MTPLVLAIASCNPIKSTIFTFFSFFVRLVPFRFPKGFQRLQGQSFLCSVKMNENVPPLLCGVAENHRLILSGINSRQQEAEAASPLSLAIQFPFGHRRRRRRRRRRRASSAARKKPRGIRASFSVRRKRNFDSPLGPRCALMVLPILAERPTFQTGRTEQRQRGHQQTQEAHSSLGASSPTGRMKDLSSSTRLALAPNLLALEQTHTDTQTHRHTQGLTSNVASPCPPPPNRPSRLRERDILHRYRRGRNESNLVSASLDLDLWPRASRGSR